jgi:hypothetical protein
MTAHDDHLRQHIIEIWVHFVNLGNRPFSREMNALVLNAVNFENGVRVAHYNVRDIIAIIRMYYNN